MILFKKNIYLYANVTLVIGLESSKYSLRTSM